MPGYTFTVYLLFVDASVILSTADLILVKLVSLPGNPTVTRLSMNVGGAYEAEVANDAVAGVNVIDVAALAVVANELDIALVAQLLVPNSDPVNEPVNDPVLNCVDEETVPAGIGAHDAEVANDALVDRVAQLLVPKNPMALERELVYDRANTKSPIVAIDPLNPNDAETLPL